MLTKYILASLVLIACATPQRVHADQFTRSCVKILVVVGIVAGIGHWRQIKDNQADEAMLADTNKLLTQMHLEYDYKFELQDQKNSVLVAALGARLLESIPQKITLLSEQETILQNRLERARIAFFRQNAAMIKRVEETKKEVLELIDRLKSLLYYLQINSVAALK